MDPWLDRLALITLSIIAVIGLVGIVVLSGLGEPLPASLTTGWGAVLGVFAGWFVRSLAARNGPGSGHR